MALNKVLVSDFDGTMTQRDFYACAVQYLLSPEDLEPWHAYTLALQSVGGAMGNMVAIHNIVAVCSVLGLGNREGEILKQTVGPMLLYGVIAALMSLAFSGSN